MEKEQLTFTQARKLRSRAAEVVQVSCLVKESCSGLLTEVVARWREQVRSQHHLLLIHPRQAGSSPVDPSLSIISPLKTCHPPQGALSMSLTWAMP